MPRRLLIYHVFYAILSRVICMKKAVLSVLLCLCCLSLAGCMGPFPERIAPEKFEDVTTQLAEQYELTLPSSAEFVGGYYDNAFRDPSLTVAFTVARSELDAMLSEHWKEASVVGKPAILKDQLALDDFTPDGQYHLETELYTFLWYTQTEDGRLLCLFSGRNPIQH